MLGAITRGKVLLMAVGLGLALLALAACGSESKTPAAAGQQAQQDAPANLLGSPAGAAAYEALARGLASTGTGSSTGLWVSGQGEASAVPDLAVLNLGIEAFAGTVAEARADGAAAMALVLAALKAKGVSDADIQTRNFNISARYTTQEVTKCVNNGESGTLDKETPALPMGAPEPSMTVEPEIVLRSAAGEECAVERERVILGYDVTNQLSVKVRDLESVGPIIDDVTEAGGDLTRFQSVSFTIEDTAALEDQARAAAIQDLMGKAQRVASLAGVELGGLSYITESGGGAPAPMVAMERAVFADSAVATSIMAGELEVTVHVQAAFNIQQTGS